VWQLLLCLFFAILSYFWKDIYGQMRYYMAFDVFVEVRPRAVSLSACAPGLSARPVFLWSGNAQMLSDALPVEV
jgi:hypothetical protein